jgi:hypothetical protein
MTPLHLDGVHDSPHATGQCAAMGALMPPELPRVATKGRKEPTPDVGERTMAS